ncbi:Rod binding protein [Pseudoxanthobacter soli DSM 19599]|uniref:Rod binding protein n=1 Tax=Pseudoxanthobacter soli DSM 19599 TaxID=1123029 RepID=A0A1M7ZE91_9HYPH|nr:rod-binding protein [Pseudoxanthobacter soli]SHO63197.1 Rod binding protein [Pseudoxanthobacter soli DSM 19599]
MSVSIPSDIVLDVVHAADPLRYQSAADRLFRAGQTGGSDAFQDVFDTFGADAGPRRAGGYGSLDSLGVSGRTVPVPKACSPEGQDGTERAALKKYQAFEAMALSSFVQEMLPKDAEAVFGSGTAGDVWKTMLAEQIGNQIAAAGGIGIAKQLLKSHPVDDGEASRAEATLGPVSLSSVLSQLPSGGYPDDASSGAVKAPDSEDLI